MVRKKKARHTYLTDNYRVALLNSKFDKSFVDTACLQNMLESFQGLRVAASGEGVSWEFWSIDKIIQNLNVNLSIWDTTVQPDFAHCTVSEVYQIYLHGRTVEQAWNNKGGKDACGDYS